MLESIPLPPKITKKTPPFTTLFGLFINQTCSHYFNFNLMHVLETNLKENTDYIKVDPPTSPLFPHPPLLQIKVISL